MLNALRVEVPFFNKALTAPATPLLSSYQLPASKIQLTIRASSFPRSMANTSTPLLNTCLRYNGNSRLNSLASLKAGAIFLFNIVFNSTLLFTLIIQRIAVIGIEDLTAGGQDLTRRHRLVFSQFGIHHIRIPQQFIDRQAVGPVHHAHVFKYDRRLRLI